jgi:predicted ATPase
MYSAWGTILCGWALAEQGQGDEGIDEMRRGIAAWRAIGAAMMLSNWLASLAKAYAKVGKREGALRLLDEALSLVDRNEERCWEAELHRLKGELFLKEGRDAQAEACFERALKVARRQSAKSLELRAATSLSRLWQRQDKGKEARELLQGAYDWFSEGFATADLVEAKALLDELS